MYKNVASQYVFVFARDIVSDAPKTGDSANITINITGDNGVLGPSSNSVSELDAANAKGVYKLALTQGETNADSIVFTGLSTTAGVEIVPIFVQTQTVMRGTDGGNTTVPLSASQDAAGHSATLTELTSVIGPAITLIGFNVVLVLADTDFLQKVAEGDMTIDTTTTPWQMVVKEKDASNELIRKDMKTPSGDDITSEASIVGQIVEP